MTLFDDLRALLPRAYAPYSGFRVASIVVDGRGRRYGGVNVESAAYPVTMCAERAAVFRAVAEGCAPGDIREVHILAHDGRDFVEATPCGACRQVIAEQSRNGATVFLYGPEGFGRTYAIADLLPHAFTL